MTHAITRMILEDIRLGEIGQSRKDPCCMISRIWSTQSGQVHRNRAEWWLPVSGGQGGSGAYCLMGPVFPFGKMESSGEGRMVVTVPQQCECT